MEVAQKTYICCFWKTYNMKEIILRAVSGVLYISIVILTLFTSHKWFIGLFLILGLITLYEFLRLFKLKNFLPYLFMLILIYFFSYKQIDIRIVYILLLCTLIVNIILLNDLFKKNNVSYSRIIKIMISIFYLVSGFIYLTLIPFYEGYFDSKVIFGVFVLIWSNDTFAYLIGKSIGKRKLFERISPKKTIEGFLGGLIGSLIISFIIFKYTLLFNFGIWMALAVLISVFGTIGDLVQSKFKRNAGVKDSGVSMPGHGGLYDRLDSILFASPFIFAFLEIIAYVS